MKRLLLLFCVCQVLTTLDGTLSKSSGKKKTVTPKKKVTSGNRRDEQTRESSSLTYLDILQNHAHVDYTEDKNFPNLALAYVTPWNSHGYDIAKWLAHKFTHVSPVWFTVTWNGDVWHFEGGHDVDRGWIADVRSNNSNVRIVPRFLFSGLSARDLKTLATSEARMEELAEQLWRFLSRNKFDGMVMEIWIQFVSVAGGSNLEALGHLVSYVGETLGSHALDLILVIPPPIGPSNEPSPLVPSRVVAHVAQFVTAISVMTYDFPGRGPGPVAPLPWVRACMEHLVEALPVESRAKLLLGLNFYGYEHSTEDGQRMRMDAVIGRRYLELLNEFHPQIFWGSPAEEHFLELSDRIVFYPSLFSIEARLNVAKNMGVGLAIWEVGQGLDYFYNLL